MHASVSSDVEFAVLFDGLAPVAYHMDRPPGLARSELHERPVDPGSAILEFVRQIENLPPAAREFWAAAARRVFDIGFESGQEPHARSMRTTASVPTSSPQSRGSAAKSKSQIRARRRKAHSDRATRSA